MTSGAYGYQFKWSDRPGSFCFIQNGGFNSTDDRDKDWNGMLHMLDYEPPRWWQWWRWGETVPKCWER